MSGTPTTAAPNRAYLMGAARGLAELLQVEIAKLEADARRFDGRGYRLLGAELSTIRARLIDVMKAAELVAGES